MGIYKHKELTDKIIQAFYCVYNELGFGFLENVYQNALYFELINYLKATDKEIGLLLNFGTKPEIRRKIFDNNLKNLCKSI